MGNIIKNPYTTDGNWYIGQLHFHTTVSDGAGTPAQMKAAYASAGYDFVITTDHRGPSYAENDDGCTPDPGGAGPLWILGEEETLTDRHMCSLGITEQLQQPWVTPQTIQWDIDRTRTLGGIAMAAHPAGAVSWEWWAETEPSKRLSLVEVNIFDGLFTHWDRAAINLWDELRQVWATTTDDAHNATTMVNKGCVVVQTGSGTITQADIISSLDSGNFYMRQTSTGPTISSVSVSGQIITVTLPAGSYTVNWYKKGRRLAETDSAVTTTASYTVTGTEGYVFAEINNGTNLAYTQPLFILNDIDLSNAAAASEGTAANLIDNDQGTTCDWTAATGNFTIDVGAAKQVNGVRIYWNCATTERWNYKVEESTTGAFAGEQTEQVRTTFSNRASTTVDVFDVWTRYIKVTITGASVGAENVSVKEVEVFDASPEISEYYVNNVSGNDSNAGFTPGTAFLTSNAAQLFLRPRDRLNFINSGTPYSTIRPDTGAVGIPFGKHAGAYCYFNGLNFPTLTSNARAFFVNDAAIHFMSFSGFNVTGCTGNASINVAAGHDIIITRNIIQSGESSAIYFSGTATNVTASYNICSNNGKTLTSPTINEYLGAGAVAYIYNNTVYDGYRGIWVNQAAASIAYVKNNIVLTMSQNQGLLRTDAKGGTLYDSNNANATGYVGTWAKTNNVDLDPQFVNAAAGDFRLKQTSPLLRKGVGVGLTFDIAGNTVPAWTGKAPDIGAYENRPGGVFIF